RAARGGGGGGPGVKRTKAGLDIYTDAISAGLSEEQATERAQRADPTFVAPTGLSDRQLTRLSQYSQRREQMGIPAAQSALSDVQRAFSVASAGDVRAAIAALNSGFARHIVASSSPRAMALAQALQRVS